MPTKLKTIVDDIATVPEAYRTQYSKSPDGKYILQEVEIPDPADVDGLIKKNAELINEKKKLEQKYAGIDPDEYQKLSKAQQLAERARLESKGEWEALERQLIEKHVEDLKKKDDEIGSLTFAVEERLVDTEASAAIIAAKGNAVLLLPHVKQNIRVVRENDESGHVRFIARVVDSNGNPRIGDAKGSPMTIKQLVEEMRSDDRYSRAFEATYARGSGAPSNAGRKAVTVTITREQYNQMSPGEQHHYLLVDKGVVVDA